MIGKAVAAAFGGGGAHSTSTGEHFRQKTVSLLFFSFEMLNYV